MKFKSGEHELTTLLFILLFICVERRLEIYGLSFVNFLTCFSDKQLPQLILQHLRLIHQDILLVIASASI